MPSGVDEARKKRQFLAEALAGAQEPEGLGGLPVQGFQSGLLGSLFGPQSDIVGEVIRQFKRDELLKSSRRRAQARRNR